MWNKIAHYKSICQYILILHNLNRMLTYEIILRKMYHIWTCETILRNKNHKPTYKTILCIINPYVYIWNHIPQHKSYVDIWSYIARYKPYFVLLYILHGINHMSTYKQRCTLGIHMLTYRTMLCITNLYLKIWDHIVQYKLHVNIWNNITHFEIINRHMDSYRAI